jgi:uncharacterized repeat protein (TIGR01451 family)
MTIRWTRQKWAGMYAVVALAAAAGAANAAGTDAGTTVSNTFTLDYEVGGVPQTQLGNAGAPTQFTVDRLVDLAVTSQGDTSVTPGATAQTLVFAVRNDGNDNQAYSFAVKDVAGDDFDAAPLSALYFVDDGDGVFEPCADDGAGTAYVLGSGAASSDIAPDEIVWVRLSADIPVATGNGDADGVTLIADTLNPTASLDPLYSSVAGDETLAAAGPNTMVGEAENVLADGAGTAGGPEDVANDGAHSDTASYLVASADLTASKSVTIVATDGAAIDCASDPSPGGAQFAAPGACIEYLISASNDPGAAASATNIDISDVLPDEVQFVAATQSGFSVAGVLTPPAGGCVAGCTVTLTGATLNAGATGEVRIRALVR